MAIKDTSRGPATATMARDDRPGPDPVCTIVADDGRLVGRLHRPNGWDRESPATVALAEVAAVDQIKGDHDRAFRDGVARGSLSTIARATEHLLADVYELISAPLLDLIGEHPRVALDLRGPLVRSLPIETAHRDTEPALFEKAQLYRLDGARRAAVAGPTRRFRLSFHDAEVGALDVIALEQSLIRWVSTLAGPTETMGGRHEPLIHVAGHDPTIPADLVDPDSRAHVVLSGCRSLPEILPPGVASTVGSLWDVDDHSSSSIMAAYHARLAMGISPIESLRQAQLLHRHLPPAAWAAYVHVGQPV